MDLKFLGQVQTFDHRRREVKGCHTVGRRMTTVYELLFGYDRLQQLCSIFYWAALRMVPVEKIETFARIWSQLPGFCLLYTSPSPRDGLLSRMPSSA